jgi:repressor of nif and glnA expression
MFDEKSLTMLHLQDSVLQDGSSSSGKTATFLTHDWGRDELGRDNHARVSFVNGELKKRGYSTWFDSDKMTGKFLLSY